MKEHFAEQLESLRQQLILMAVEAESQVRLAVEALVEADAGKAARVIERDKLLDQMEVRNEDMTVHLMATQQPVAGDLRFLVAALKINNELERIGDHAVNIAEEAIFMARGIQIKHHLHPEDLAS
jgi:phosphate transport system protein